MSIFKIDIYISTYYIRRELFIANSYSNIINHIAPNT